MAKTYKIGGVDCIVKFKRGYGETFIHPTRESGKWEGNEYQIVSDLCVANGRDVYGGHEYCIIVVGDIRKPVTKAEAALNLELMSLRKLFGTQYATGL